MGAAFLSIGIDLGGTKIAAALVDPLGVVQHEITIPTEVEKGPHSIVNRIADLIKKLCQAANDSFCPVGIAVAGQIEAGSGNVIFAPNLNWQHFPLKQELTKLIDLPITVVNDVRAAAYGEWHYGAGLHLQHFICLFIGTGIGGGIVSNGCLLQGSSNSAGELGHMVICLRGRLCSCGNRGCLEAYASGWAIAEIARERVQAKRKEGRPLLMAAEGDVAAITAKDVCRLFEEEDPLAVSIIDGAIDALSGGIVTLVNAFNPSHIILGGGIVNGMPGMIERLDRAVKAQALHAATRNLSIVPALLKVNAGIVGSANIGKACC